MMELEASNMRIKTLVVLMFEGFKNVPANCGILNDSFQAYSNTHLYLINLLTFPPLVVRPNMGLPESNIPTIWMLSFP